MRRSCRGPARARDSSRQFIHTDRPGGNSFTPASVTRGAPVAAPFQASTHTSVPKSRSHGGGRAAADAAASSGAVGMKSREGREDGRAAGAARIFAVGTS